MQRQGLLSPGRAMKERLETLREDDERRMHGIGRIWGTLSIFIIAGSWLGWGWLAVHDHNQIVQLRQELRHEQEIQRLRDTPPDGLETWHALKVTTVGYDNFRALTLNPSTHEWIEAFYQLCSKPDGTLFELDHDIRPGVTIKAITWRVDRLHACKDMNSHFAGTAEWRDTDGNLILADYSTGR